MDIRTKLPLISVRGTAIYIHLLSIAVIGWYVLRHAAGDNSALLALSALAGALLVHELGHLLAARYLGITAMASTVYPFGSEVSVAKGISPRSFLAYRLAGPAVNLIAAVILGVIEGDLGVIDSQLSELTRLFQRYNLILALLNLLPFAPLDCGDAFAEGARQQNPRATSLWGWRGGTACAVLLGALGVGLGDPLPFAAAIAVALATVSAVARARTKMLLGNTTISSVMTRIEDLPTFAHGATVGAIITEVLRSHHTVFRICHGTTTGGVLFREDLVDAAIQGGDVYVAELIDRGLTTISAELPLEDVLDILTRGDAGDPLLVSREGNLAGIVFREQLLEFVLVRNSERAARAAVELE